MYSKICKKLILFIIVVQYIYVYRLIIVRCRMRCHYVKIKEIFMFEDFLLFIDPGVIRLLLLAKHVTEYLADILPTSPTVFSFPQGFSFCNSVLQGLFFRKPNMFRFGRQYFPESLNYYFNNESPAPLLNNR